jgi:hypothetical protein
MRNRKEPYEKDFGLLFLGLTAGFLLGGIVVYWQSSRQNDRMLQEMYLHLSTIFHEYTSRSDQKTSPLQPYIPEIPQNIQVSFKETHADFLGNRVESPFPDEFDSLNLDKTPTHPEKIVLLAQDKLLLTRKVVLPALPDKRTTAERLLDSLLGNTQNYNKEQTLYVEFWESPLNSRGYKMSKNKIMFYGIKLFDFTSISLHGNVIYLKYLNDLYPLELTNSFKPLIPLRDTYIIDPIDTTDPVDIDTIYLP